MKKMSTASNHHLVAQQFSIAFSTDADYLEPLLKDRCLCGTVSILIGLRAVAFVNFLLAATCIYLAMDSAQFIYYFVNALISFAIFCSVLSGIQSEQKNLLKFAKWALMARCLLVTGLLVSAIYSVIYHLIDTSSGDEREESLSLATICLIIVLNCTLLVSIGQLYLSARAIRYVRIRDCIYTIPNPPRTPVQNLSVEELAIPEKPGNPVAIA